MKQLNVLSEQQGGKFLDPDNVGSTIQWFVKLSLEEIEHGSSKGKIEPCIAGAVNMSDCSRLISWSFSSNEDLSKIDRAITELRQARASLADALRKKVKHETG